MLKAGQECPSRPTIPSPDVRILRVKLIAEELMELCDALGIEMRLWCCPGLDKEINVACHESVWVDMTQAYDGVLDLEVVTTGTAVALGINTEPGWQEVHRSNMSKFIDGHKREDGKWVKGPSYSPANLKPILDHLARHDEIHTPTGE